MTFFLTSVHRKMNFGSSGDEPLLFFCRYAQNLGNRTKPRSKSQHVPKIFAKVPFSGISLQKISRKCVNLMYK